MAEQTYKLAVFEQGKGQPLVMLHGLISTHRYWNQVVTELDQAKWHIISPDLLGFGDSPKPKDGRYDLDEYTTSVNEAVTSSFRPPYTLVAHSMGAIIAVNWASTKPELFSNIILTSLPLFTPDNMWQQLASIANNDRIIKRKSVAKAAVKSFGWASLLPVKVISFQSQWPAHIMEDSKKHSRHAYRKSIKNMVFAEELLSQLADLKVPTTLIVGEKDGMVGEAGIKRLKEVAKDNKNLKLEILDEGHNIPLVSPKIVAKAILQV